VVVDHFDLSTRSLAVSGSAEIAADGLPERVDVTGTLAAPDGQPVALPFTEGTRVTSADFQLTSVQKGENSWSGSASVVGLDREDMKIARLALSGGGE
jgi:translocation and assembly module TamB